jgi:hypothetical protein
MSPKKAAQPFKEGVKLQQQRYIVCQDGIETAQSVIETSLATLTTASYLD